MLHLLRCPIVEWFSSSGFSPLLVKFFSQVFFFCVFRLYDRVQEDQKKLVIFLRANGRLEMKIISSIALVFLFNGPTSQYELRSNQILMAFSSLIDHYESLGLRADCTNNQVLIKANSRGKL